MQASNTYKDIEKVANLLFERLRDWYGIYLPELELNNPETYAKLVIELGSSRKQVSEETLESITGEKAKELYNTILQSSGKEPNENEYSAVSNLAKTGLALVNLQHELDRYIEKASKELMPNISYLIDCKIAAELLAKAGSLERLSNMPASTIQLLGAEKALFKHLKFGSRPPKYGILFRLPQVVNAPRTSKGRIARIYATKISIASRADAISKRFIADKLKEDIEKAIKKSRS